MNQRSKIPSDVGSAILYIIEASAAEDDTEIAETPRSSFEASQSSPANQTKIRQLYRCPGIILQTVDFLKVQIILQSVQHTTI